MDKNLLRAKVIAKSIFVLDDAGAVLLYKFFNGDEEVMKEYFYLKAFIFIRTLDDVVSCKEYGELNPNQLAPLVFRVFDVINATIQKGVPDFKGSFDEMEARVDYYHEKVNRVDIDCLSREFINVIGEERLNNKGITLTQISKAVEFGINHIGHAIVDPLKLPPQKSRGCLTTIACFILVLAIAIL